MQEQWGESTGDYRNGINFMHKIPWFVWVSIQSMTQSDPEYMQQQDQLNAGRYSSFRLNW